MHHFILSSLCLTNKFILIIFLVLSVFSSLESFASQKELNEREQFTQLLENLNDYIKKLSQFYDPVNSEMTNIVLRSTDKRIAPEDTLSTDNLLLHREDVHLLMVRNNIAIDSLTEIKDDFEEVWHKLFDLSQELTESEHRAQLLERLGNYITTLCYHELINNYWIGKIMDLLTELLNDNRENDLRLRLRAEIEYVNTNVSNSKVMLELIVKSLSEVHEELLNSQY